MKNPNEMMKKEFLTVADICAYLNISQGKAYALTHRSDFPVCRLGSCIRIPRNAFLAWIAQMTYLPPALTKDAC